MLRNRSARRSWFDRSAEAIGQAGLTPHGLRHTAASLAVSSGANVKAIQRMPGHASAAMTLDIYDDLFDSDLDVVADRLDETRAALFKITLMTSPFDSPRVTFRRCAVSPKDQIWTSEGKKIAYKISTDDVEQQFCAL